MAATTFKQQCPSCEANVPIRDPALIGRKIDCPKCKYRFVVEEPKTEDKAGPTVNGKNGKNGKNGSTITDKKPANGKSKAGPVKRRGEDEETAKPAPKKKQGGKSGVLIA